MNQPTATPTTRSRSATRSRMALRLAVLVAAMLLAASAGTPATATTRVSGSALDLLARLKTAPERPDGYDRDLFEHWVDADHDGCTTRGEVLMAESETTAQVGEDCAVTGSWRSVYDGVITTKPSSLDIDHVVPLKEAWDSGAWAWTSSGRRRFANDLGDWRALRAVTAASNRSKGDKDPAQWLPPLTSFHCTYATDWVVVKVRWSLRVDAGERSALRGILSECPARTVRVAILGSVVALPTPTPSPSPSPSLTASPIPSPSASPVASPTPSGALSPGASPAPMVRQATGPRTESWLSSR